MSRVILANPTSSPFSSLMRSTTTLARIATVLSTASLRPRTCLARASRAPSGMPARSSGIEGGNASDDLFSPKPLIRSAPAFQLSRTPSGQHVDGVVDNRLQQQIGFGLSFNFGPRHHHSNAADALA